MQVMAVRFLMRSLVTGVVGDTYTDHKIITQMLTSVRAYLYCLGHALEEALRGGRKSFGLGGQVLL